VDATNAMLCWNPNSDQVLVVPWPDKAGHASGYEREALAAYKEVREMTFEQRKAHIFIEAMHLIVRDHVNPIAVHQALLGLDEYRKDCAEDMPGIPIDEV